MNALPAKFDTAADSPDPVTTSTPLAGHNAARPAIAVGVAFDALVTNVAPGAKAVNVVAPSVSANRPTTKDAIRAFFTRFSWALSPRFGRWVDVRFVVTSRCRQVSVIAFALANQPANFPCTTSKLPSRELFVRAFLARAMNSDQVCARVGWSAIND